MWFIGVDEEQDTSAPAPKKNPGSAPDFAAIELFYFGLLAFFFKSRPLWHTAVSSKILITLTNKFFKRYRSSNNYSFPVPSYTYCFWHHRHGGGMFLTEWNTN